MDGEYQPLYRSVSVNYSFASFHCDVQRTRSGGEAATIQIPRTTDLTDDPTDNTDPPFHPQVDAGRKSYDPISVLSSALGRLYAALHVSRFLFNSRIYPFADITLFFLEAHVFEPVTEPVSDLSHRFYSIELLLILRHS